MIRHSVFFWLDDSLCDDDKAAFEGGLAALFEIEVVSAGSFGRAAGTPERTVTHNGFDYALVLEFENIEKHNAYQAHPEHKVFVEKFSLWFKEVRVFDIQF
ncbi:MAG: transcription-repair coupling factor [Verrucomicrobiales bacterium]|nr:transcription-repair coupling factor [Verrucomicrobiales bacterium]|tara:strand:- start:39396 stop:39698 length:303 start_codon:yes stop_codon:yes gene_type:complete